MYIVQQSCMRQEWDLESHSTHRKYETSEWLVLQTSHWGSSCTFSKKVRRCSWSLYFIEDFNEAQLASNLKLHTSQRQEKPEQLLQEQASHVNCSLGRVFLDTPIRLSLSCGCKGCGNSSTGSIQSWWMKNLHLMHSYDWAQTCFSHTPQQTSFSLSSWIGKCLCVKYFTSPFLSRDFKLRPYTTTFHQKTK